VKFGVVRFPGSCDEVDALMACRRFAEADLLWHGDRDLDGIDAVVVPGGFSYGDYLRVGAIARFSPLMESVIEFAHDGGPVLGICNGFQVLCEAGLLPGVLMRNASLKFVCRDVLLKVEQTDTLFTSRFQQGEVIRIPVAHGDGNYFADKATLDTLEAEGRIVFRYVDDMGNATPEASPNGALHNIAGICDERRRVLGLMPHPERLFEPMLGGTDGRKVFESILERIAA
jgi:phosphoribosylformylglycinamidine synthase subunit PurQ / glutaminase